MNRERPWRAVIGVVMVLSGAAFLMEDWLSVIGAGVLIGCGFGMMVGS